MKYSILLTTYDPDKKLVEMTEECKAKIKENSKSEDYELIELDEPGIIRAINRGFREAKGKYVILMANDVMIEDSEWLEKMAVPGTITSFLQTEFSMGRLKFPELDASCHCIPKDVREKIGFYDERFEEGYGYCDNDFFFRAHQLGIPVQQVDVKLRHLTGATEQVYYKHDHKQRLQRNAEIFNEKWKQYID